MGRHDVADRERAALLDRAEAAGADAPTLCEGWTVHHLLAHMWVREHEPLATPGLVAWGLLLSLLVGFVAGAIPAWQAGRSEIVSSLR